MWHIKKNKQNNQPSHTVNLKPDLHNTENQRLIHRAGARDHLMTNILNGADPVLNKERALSIMYRLSEALHQATHTVQAHTHGEDIADEVLVNTLHHGVGGYTRTSPSHPSSFASLSPAPPSNPPHNLSLQLEPTSHTHLLFIPLLCSLSILQSWIAVLSIQPSWLVFLSPYCISVNLVFNPLHFCPLTPLHHWDHICARLRQSLCHQHLLTYVPWYFIFLC